MSFTAIHEMELHADPTRRVVLDTRQLARPEDMPTGVCRMPLANGDAQPAWRAEIVQYPAGSVIREIDPGGAEILVLEGEIEDAASVSPAGAYLRLPPGWSGELASATGCLLFVKRGHLDARDTRKVRLHPGDRVWFPGLVPGLRVLSLGEYDGASSALVNWQPGTRFQYHRHYGGEEIFVMEGTFQDEHGDYPAGTWLRSPHMSEHTPYSDEGCLIFVKVGHLLGRS